MRIRITGKGIFGAKGEIPVGAEFEVEKEPTAWAGRYLVLDEGAAEGTELVTAMDAPVLTDEEREALILAMTDPDPEDEPVIEDEPEGPPGEPEDEPISSSRRSRSRR